MLRRQLSLLEVLFVVLLVLIVFALILPAFTTCCRSRGRAALVKEGAQQREIHRAMLVFAEDGNGHFPTPGRLNPQRDPGTGLQLPGIGPENHRKNLTRHVYSAMIALEYFDTDIMISPAEENPAIAEYVDYDYSEYAPLADTYWDGDATDDDSEGARWGFDIAFGDNDRPCHASFPLQTIAGLRAEQEWRASGNAAHTVISTRGPTDGALHGAAYDNAYALRMHGKQDAWLGAIVFSDNHIELRESFILNPANPGSAADNLFRAEDGPMGADVWIGFTKRVRVGAGGLPEGAELWEEPLVE